MNYRLLPGDCLEVMPTLEAGSIDLILVDTPFGTTKNAWDTVLDLPEMWAQSRRIIKPNGAIVHFATQPYTSMLVMSNLHAYRHKWVWNKNNSAGFATVAFRPLHTTEDILVFGFDSVNYYPQMETRGSIRMKGGGPVSENYGIKPTISFNNEYHPKHLIHISNADQVDKLHPTQKPVDLLAYLIKNYTLPGDTVLDFTFGSCSTGIACIETGRNFVGIEKDPEYFRIGEERIAAAYRRANGEARKGKASDTENLPLFA